MARPACRRSPPARRHQVFMPPTSCLSLLGFESTQVRATVHRPCEALICMHNRRLQHACTEHCTPMPSNPLFMHNPATHGRQPRALRAQLFVRGLLDKLHVAPEVFRREEYKAAMAPYTGSAFDEHQRENLTSVLQVSVAPQNSCAFVFARLRGASVCWHAFMHAALHSRLHTRPPIQSANTMQPRHHTPLPSVAVRPSGVWHHVRAAAGARGRQRRRVGVAAAAGRGGAHGPAGRPAVQVCCRFGCLAVLVLCMPASQAAVGCSLQRHTACTTPVLQLQLLLLLLLLPAGTRWSSCWWISCRRSTASQCLQQQRRAAAAVAGRSCWRHVFPSIVMQPPLHG